MTEGGYKLEILDSRRRGIVLSMYSKNKVTAQLICIFGFAFVDCCFFDAAAQLFLHTTYEPPRGKTNNVVSEQVREEVNSSVQSDKFSLICLPCIAVGLAKI